ncbi:hypothetical protein [Geosporobacter ferrireducens]|uniref:CARD domain-containing protein n=1 Tax=Geosporobacter ferrireducens TaxID=1424294 RepID=A0A1D8GFQ5_9FIRM|nr:hypothetical protein [Geosporobacter ferrireducens]AOT69742.1 hypothetical protein Gferi_09185 [Geosporobacter ferrireducens]
MEKRLFMKKMLSGVLVSSMMFTMGGAVFAKETEGTADAAAEKNTKIMQKFKAGSELKKENGFALKSQVPGKGLEAVLDKLAEEGTLSKEKVEEVKKYLEEKMEAKKAEFEKIKDLTEEERQKYFEENKANKTERVDFIEQLVKDGVITEAQEEQIKAKMKEMMPQGLGKRGYGKDMSVLIGKLVEEGKLTEEKAEALKAYFEKKAEAKKAQFEELKNMTKEERQKYFEENKIERKNIFDQLVEDGILTKEEAENLKALKTRPSKEKNDA